MNEYEELLDCGFEVILTHPGCQYNEWKNTLIEDYPTEVADVLGCDINDIEKGLSELWIQPYMDALTNTPKTLSEWAKQLQNEDALREYFTK